MVTGLILLPVVAILVWLYWYLLPGRRWRLADSLVLGVLLLSTVFYVRWVETLDLSSGGPMWPYIVSAVGAYGMLVMGLAFALAWRRYRA